MLRITLDMSIPKIDEDAFTEAMMYALLARHRKAAEVFFITAIALVHIDTGMSLGSYLGLAAYLDMEIERLNGYPMDGPTPPKKYKTPPPEFKSPAGGASLATQEDKLFELNWAKNEVRFHFHTDVYQFKLYQGWGSMLAGAEAMMRYLAAHPPTIVNIEKYLTKYNYRTTATGSGSPEITVERVRRQKNVGPNL